jgi:hypothetical protein
MCRFEPVQPTLVHQLPDVGQLALCGVPFHQIRIHAVEAKDHELLGEPAVRSGGRARGNHANTDDANSRESQQLQSHL